VHDKYDSARVLWHASLDSARASRDKDREARALTGNQLRRLRLSDYEEARTSAEQSIEVARGRAPTRSLPKAYNVLGLITMDDGKFAEAQRLFERAIETGRAANDSDVIARALGNLGSTAENLGDLRPRPRGPSRATSARTGARQSAGRGKQLSRTKRTTTSGREIRDRPSRVLDSARALYRRASFATGEQVALTVLATALEATGEVAAAFAALDTGPDSGAATRVKSREAEVLRLLAEMHLSVGDYRRAVDYAEEAESRMRAMRLRGPASRCAAARGGCLSAAWQPDARARER
jgi:tetratricopeptide (TPR) repeat protein